MGIDLGTTYSVVARLDERGQPVTLVNAEGDRLTPSVVLLDGDDVVVGKEAMKAMSSEADRVAECAKRDMGHRAYHRAIDGKQYPPEVIQAWILNKLRGDAMQQIGPFDKAVITVPAYFDEVRRKATQDAGYMAGCEVLDIINEPTAAAVAFGFQQGFLNAAGSTDRPRRVLVYDLGGGTFDVTVMEIRGSEFLALATDGDVALGGYDWDQRLLNLAADAFQREHGLDLRARPRRGGKALAGMRRRQADAFRPAQGPRRRRISRQGPPRGNLPRAVRRGDAGPPGSHPLHLRAGPAGGGPGLVRSRSRAAGRRFHPHADGPRDVAEAQRQAARRFGGGRRGGGPRRGPAGRIGPGQARRPGGEFQHPQRQLAQPGRGGHRPADQAPPQRHRHSPQHAPAGQRQAEVQDGQGTTSARSSCRSWKARALRPTTARPSAAARWPIFRPGCRPSRRSTCVSTIRPTAA